LRLPRAPRSDAKRPAGCWPWRWSSRKTPKTVGYIELTCIDIYIYGERDMDIGIDIDIDIDMYIY
jgi:hypothetical protein